MSNFQNLKTEQLTALFLERVDFDTWQNIKDFSDESDYREFLIGFLVNSEKQLRGIILNVEADKMAASLPPSSFDLGFLAGVCKDSSFGEESGHKKRRGQRKTRDEQADNLAVLKQNERKARIEQMRALVEKHGEDCRVTELMPAPQYEGVRATAVEMIEKALS